MHLDEMRLFVALRDAATLAEAGRRVDLGPAGVSAALKRLERRTGVRLVERTTRRFRLTSEGEQLLETCERVLEVWDAGQERLRGTHAGVAGPLVVSAPADLGRQHVHRWLAALGRAHPDLQIVLHAVDRLDDLAARPIDIALRYGHLEDSQLVARQLALGRRILVASAAYLERAPALAHPRDLAAHQLLPWMRDDRPFARWRLVSDAAEHTVEARSTLCGDGALVRQWAVDGEGVAFKSWLDVVDDLAAGRLVHVLPEWSDPGVPLYAVTPSRGYRAARVRVALDWLQRCVEQLESARTVSRR